MILAFSRFIYKHKIKADKQDGKFDKERPKKQIKLNIVIHVMGMCGKHLMVFFYRASRMHLVGRFGFHCTTFLGLITFVQNDWYACPFAHTLITWYSWFSDEISSWFLAIGAQYKLIVRETQANKKTLPTNSSSNWIRVTNEMHPSLIFFAHSAVEQIIILWLDLIWNVCVFAMDWTKDE